MASKKNLKRELRQERARLAELEAEKEGLSQQLRRTRRHLTGCQAQLADEQSRSRYATSEQVSQWAFNNDVILVTRQILDQLGLDRGVIESIGHAQRPRAAPSRQAPAMAVTERPKDLVVVRISVEAEDGQRYGIQVPFSWRFIAWRFVLPAICKGQRDLLRVAPAGTDPKRLVWEVAHYDY